MLGLRVRTASVRLPLRRAQSTLSGLSDKKQHIFNGEDQSALLDKQAPNREATWAPSQRPIKDAMQGPRFDGRDLSTQPRPEAAINLIAQQPIQFVHDTKAVCDGNITGRRGGVQGHPRIYIDVEQPGAHACQYCGNRFAHASQAEALGQSS